MENKKIVWREAKSIRKRKKQMYHFIKNMDGELLVGKRRLGENGDNILMVETTRNLS